MRCKIMQIRSCDQYIFHLWVAGFCGLSYAFYLKLISVSIQKLLLVQYSTRIYPGSAGKGLFSNYKNPRYGKLDTS